MINLFFSSFANYREKSLLFNKLCWAYEGGYGYFIFKSQRRLAGTLKSINYTLKCTASFLTREGLNRIYVKVCLTWKSFFLSFCWLGLYVKRIETFWGKDDLNKKTALQDLQWFLILKLFIFYTYVTEKKIKILRSYIVYEGRLWIRSCRQDGLVC